MKKVVYSWENDNGRHYHSKRNRKTARKDWTTARIKHGRESAKSCMLPAWSRACDDGMMSSDKLGPLPHVHGIRSPQPVSWSGFIFHLQLSIFLTFPSPGISSRIQSLISQCHVSPSQGLSAETTTLSHTVCSSPHTTILLWNLRSFILEVKNKTLAILCACDQHHMNLQVC